MGVKKTYLTAELTIDMKEDWAKILEYIKQADEYKKFAGIKLSSCKSGNVHYDKDEFELIIPETFTYVRMRKLTAAAADNIEKAINEFESVYDYVVKVMKTQSTTHTIIINNFHIMPPSKT